MGGCAVRLFDVKGLEEAIDVLHIRNIAAKADNCFAVERFQAVHVCEAGEGAVGCEVVGGDDDAGFEFEADY